MHIQTEARLFLIQNLSLIVGIFGVLIEHVPTLIGCCVVHLAVGFAVSPSKVFWLASTVILTAINSLIVWFFLVGQYQGITDINFSEHMITVVVLTAIILGGIVGELISSPGQSSILADYIEKYGPLK